MTFKCANVVSFSGAKPPDPLTRDFAPEPLGAEPSDPWRLVLHALAIVWFPSTAPNHKYHHDYGIGGGRGSWMGRTVERRRRDNRGTEGVGSGGRLPLSSRLGGLRECRKLPLRGPGQSPGHQKFWYSIYGPKK